MDQQANVGEMRQDATETRARPFSHRQYLRYVQHKRPGEFDGRTRGGRRARALIREFKAALKITQPTELERMAIERAATLQAISEDALIRRVNGDTLVSHEDIVRLAYAAERAVRALGIGDKAVEPEPLPLRERLIAGDGP
jgi:hypothetical protein